MSREHHHSDPKKSSREVRSRLMREALKDFGTGCVFMAEGAFLAALTIGIAMLALGTSAIAIFASFPILAYGALGVVCALGSLSLLFAATGAVMAAESVPTILSGGRYWPRSRSGLAHSLRKIWDWVERNNSH